ncbi:probable serine hydrolase [Tetranychus urticae]|uniref:AB hydrolase-1 domain-containing protein n=1 Tax=Tetranychus urticae TaxID=32264 RepID=T1K878_TETUR|nr:probable serine hydrolase [Tetranychus urticae]
MVKESKEIRIPIPYGFIAAKVWGNQEEADLTIIALHGWMDNASTFDPLIESLEGNYHIIAVDLPGHGLSSHYPPGVPYRNISWLIDLRRIVNFFNLDKISFLGHSMGGNVALMYACVYPEKVERIIACDIFKEATYPAESIAQEMANSIQIFLESEQRPKMTKPYSYDDCIDILISTHYNGSLNKKMASYLLKRAARETPDGYIFTRDPRLTAIVHQKYDLNTLVQLYSNAKCEKFILCGSRGTTKLDTPEAQAILDVHKSTGYFKLIKVSGDHYLHLASPIDCARHIDSFIKESVQRTKNSSTNGFPLTESKSS